MDLSRWYQKINLSNLPYNKIMEKKDLEIIKEGSAEVYVLSTDRDLVPSKSMNVFYNEKMEINRDISNLALIAYYNLYNPEHLIVIDSMAASGISSIRMLMECKNIKKMYINDLNSMAVELIQKNIALNKLDINNIQIKVSNKDANLLFSELAQKTYVSSDSEHNKANVISIDPFGTPNVYLDSAFKAIQKFNGLMCITATDTAVLFGVRPNACVRKYLAKPLRTDYTKEIGSRILVCFIARIANVNKLGIYPLLTFYSSHFIRVFCLTFKKVKTISNYFNDYGYIIHCHNCGHRASFQSNILKVPKMCPICGKDKNLDYAGPLWINMLHDREFIMESLKINESMEYSNKKRINKLLNFALEEIPMPVSYYNIHKLSQELRLAIVPKIDEIIISIKKKGYNASRTQFDFTSIKTNMDIKSLKSLLLEI